ncbi:MAG TPA: hypothetical protein VKP67_24635 [Xanthobacteraceae bacterium]|nr:hypothetical protein [Xanthobacteraceae bacterium]
MQGDKEHLNVDLGFLDEAKPREAQTQATSTYKVNWRNIAIIGGLFIALFIWVETSDKTSSRRSAPESYTPPPTYQPQTPVYRPPAASGATTVNNGQFSCSSYDSNQADLIAPKNEFELTQAQGELERRSDALDSLKLQIDTSTVNQYSDQTAIDRYNAMVSRYNAQLTLLKRDYSSHQTRIDIYNQQVQARNNYLLTHCRRSR